MKINNYLEEWGLDRKCFMKKFNLFLDLFHEFRQAKKMSETKKVEKKIEKKTEFTHVPSNFWIAKNVMTFFALKFQFQMNVSTNLFHFECKYRCPHIIYANNLDE